MRDKSGEKKVYTFEEIRKYMSEIRLLITDESEECSDENALKIIEEYVFSLSKSASCGFEDNTELIDRLFLSLRKEMDILQPYVDDREISEIMINGKDDIFVERMRA